MLKVTEKEETEGCCCNGKMFLKKLMIVFNVYYWFSGPACLGLGIWFLLITQQLEPALDPAEFSVSSYTMIGAGAAIVIYGLIGCLAIFNEHRCLLGFYFVLLATSFAAQLASCLKLFLLYDTIESHVNYNVNVSVRYRYYYDSDVTEKLDSLQQRFECCGARNYTDWENSYFTIKGGQHSNISYPFSCYAGQNSSSGSNFTNMNDTDIRIFTKGCVSPVSSVVKRFCEIFGWSTFGMSAMQVRYRTASLRWFFQAEMIGGVILYCFRTAIS